MFCKWWTKFELGFITRFLIPYIDVNVLLNKSKDRFIDNNKKLSLPDKSTAYVYDSKYLMKNKYKKTICAICKFNTTFCKTFAKKTFQ